MLMTLQIMGETSNRWDKKFDVKFPALNWIAIVARDLQHMHALNIVHGHLITENIRVGPKAVDALKAFYENSNGINPPTDLDLKIIDVEQLEAYKSGFYHLPPECLGEVPAPFCKATDVWSFGVLCWRVLTLGGHPWYSGF
jgi:serine/threonine protein kinase